MQGVLCKPRWRRSFVRNSYPSIFSIWMSLIIKSGYYRQAIAKHQVHYSLIQLHNFERKFSKRRQMLISSSKTYFSSLFLLLILKTSKSFNSHHFSDLINRIVYGYAVLYLTWYVLELIYNWTFSARHHLILRL
jgi:hypothetical protein